jgi:hypothetical protein
MEKNWGVQAVSVVFEEFTIGRWVCKWKDHMLVVIGLRYM